MFTEKEKKNLLKLVSAFEAKGYQILDDEPIDLDDVFKKVSIILMFEESVEAAPKAREEMNRLFRSMGRRC